jgi:hypothetical protein
MTPNHLAEIEDRCNRATPAPWEARHRNTCNPENDPNVKTGMDYFLGWEVDGPPESERGTYENGHDAVFVAQARTDIPDLVAEIRRLRAALEGIERDAKIACDQLCPGGFRERGMHAPDCPYELGLDARRALEGDGDATR